MMNKIEDQFIWVEAYRPQSIDECILPVKLKGVFNAFIEQGDFPHLILTGSAGVGKTTVARALCSDLGVDVLVINASENGNIDTLRTTIRQFASTVSLSGNGKVVILDEADYLNQTSTQPALRGFMEEFSKNCKFILTANYINRIIDPIQSRCSVISWAYTTEENNYIATEFMKRVQSILKREGVKVHRPSLARVIMQYFPDFRRVLNELQRLSADGSLDNSAMDQLSSSSMDMLVDHLKKKEYTAMRSWVADHSGYDLIQLFGAMRDKLEAKLKPEALPELSLIIYEFDRNLPRCTDKENATVACFVTIMMELGFK